MGASQSQPTEDVVTQINEPETPEAIVSPQEAIDSQDYTPLDWFWPIL